MATLNQLTVFVTFHIKPDLVEEWQAAHRPVWQACAAEPECILFEICQDLETPGRFRFIEVWNASKEWFQKEQLTKSYYAPMWPKSKPTWEKEPQLEYFERTGEGSIYRKAFTEVGKLMD